MDLRGIESSLEVRATSSLHPHEETIPSRVDRMVGRLLKDGVQKDPLIVDGETGVVLDGMHRLAAIARLGLRNAICGSVKYNSRAVAVKRWARVYSASNRSDLLETLELVGLTRVETVSRALRELESRRSGVVAMSSGSALAPRVHVGLVGAFSIVRKLDSIADDRRWRRRFVPEDEGGAEAAKAGRFVVMVRRLAKADVLRAALGGALFPCKISMHTVDPRPVSVNFPTSLLKGATRESLGVHMAKARGRLLPANSVYGGRRYKERLLIVRER